VRRRALAMMLLGFLIVPCNGQTWPAGCNGGIIPNDGQYAATVRARCSSPRWSIDFQDDRATFMWSDEKGLS
jgi:hypothetical protein